MNENAKTACFLGVAVIALALVWLTRPTPFTVNLDDQIGKVLNTGDPLAATSLEIIKFDEDTGEAKPFKVSQVKGVWSLPSHLDYPADGEGQLANAAASVMDLKVLGVIDATPADHSLYGVVDPATAKPGDTGVGIRVTLEDKNNQKLAQFIIGKEDKDRPNLRYLRLPGQAVVYQVEVDPSKLTTRFEDWIEDDLLKLNSFDIKQVIINSYSIDELAGTIVPGDVLELTYDDQAAKWTLSGLEEGEELDSAKLNELKTALDDLKIVDVRRKPAGLGRELRKDEGVQLDQQALASLAQHGFFLDRQGRLLSNEGEIICRLKNGVEYILRFGQIAADTGDTEDEAKDEIIDELGEDGNEPKAKGSNRYIFVMARVAEDMIPQPELEPLPGAVTAEVPQAPADDEQPADEQGADADPPADADSESEEATESSDEASGGDDDPQAEGDQAAESNEDSDATETTENAETKDESSETDSDSAESADEDPEAIKAERERIEKENQRKLDEYEDRLNKAREKVKELNDRFADWYYVISDDVYRKIRLGRADIVKRAEDAEAEIDADTLESFNQLRQGIDADRN